MTPSKDNPGFFDKTRSQPHPFGPVYHGSLSQARPDPFAGQLLHTAGMEFAFYGMQEQKRNVELRSMAQITTHQSHAQERGLNNSLNALAIVAKSDALTYSPAKNVRRNVKRYFYDHFIGLNGSISLRQNGLKMHRSFVITPRKAMISSPMLFSHQVSSFNCHYAGKSGTPYWVIAPPPNVPLWFKGGVNILMGGVGTAGAIMGAVPSGGASALALPLTIGEMGIGLAQVLDGSMNENADPNSVIHGSSSFPGLVAYQQKYKYAGLVDAGGQFLPGMFSPATPFKLGTFAIRERNIAGGIESLGESYRAFKSENIGKGLFEAASAFDAYGDVKDLGDSIWESIWSYHDKKI